MLVEFNELLDRTELSPVATNMTVEAMPNDNLVSGNVYTFFCIVSHHTALSSEWIRDHPKSSLVLYGIRAPIIGPFRSWKPPIPYAIKNQ